MGALVAFFFFSFYFRTFLLGYYSTLYILPRLYYLKLIMVVMATILLIIEAPYTFKSLFLGSVFGSTTLRNKHDHSTLCTF